MDDTIGHIISPNKALDIFNALIRSGMNKTGDLTPNGLGVFEYLSSNLKNSFNLTDDQITHIQSVVAHGSHDLILLQFYFQKNNIFNTYFLIDGQ